MAVGTFTLKSEVDVRAGQAAAAVRDAMIVVDNFKTWLDTQLDADLTALGYSAGDIASLRSSFTDLGKLRGIYLGTETQAVVYNFRVFAKLIGG